ncbi:MAG: potassium channel family protein [Dermatophilaceae bacterium]
MTWLFTALGAALILAALLDIFHTLWHPRGFGGGARRIFATVWRLTRPLSREGRSSELSGPLALVLTVLIWTLLTVLGWALVYLPHLPDGFHYGSSLDPGRSSGFLTAVYVSTVAVATLGLGDITPATWGLRLLVPLQALVGFILLTAGISWVLQLYPALGRRRSFASRLTALTRADTAQVIREGEPSVATGLLSSVTEGVLQTQTDLLQYGESYFFREESPRDSLAATGQVLVDLVDAGRASGAVEVRHAAEVLAAAVEHLVRTIVSQYPHLSGASDDEPATALRLVADDHQHEPLRLPAAG